MAVDQKYIDQATSQLTPTHNSQVTSLKNQLAQNQLALDQQKNSVNANYDLNVKNQNLNNRLNKNTVSNAMLGRGLANSSIAISGLAEQDARNARVQADIERNRVNDLGNIDANKALLEQVSIYLSIDLIENSEVFLTHFSNSSKPSKSTPYVSFICLHSS